jgi:hypothetical protein
VVFSVLSEEDGQLWTCLWNISQQFSEGEKETPHHRYIARKFLEQASGYSGFFIEKSISKTLLSPTASSLQMDLFLKIKLKLFLFFLP